MDDLRLDRSSCCRPAFIVAAACSEVEADRGEADPGETVGDSPPFADIFWG